MFKSKTIQPRKVKTAIVMANMGGPKTIHDVKSFLLRLFSDSDIIKLPFQSISSKFIANRRTEKIIKQYNQIGGGSPIHYWTEMQGSALCNILDKLSPETAPHQPYVAFRYVNPLVEETINKIEKDGAERAVFFSQFQQYSCTTSGSIINAFSRHYTQPKLRGDANIDTFDPPISVLRKSVPVPSWSFIDRWPTQAKMIQTFTQNIISSLNEIEDSKIRENTVLMFSAHSIPLDVVNRGDPYPLEVAATVQAVMEKLQFRNPYRLVWQSKVGPKQWLGPSTQNALKGFAINGSKHALIVPIAFTSDHIETLYEVDIEYCDEVAKKVGMKMVKRVKSLNDDATFIQGLADLVSDHLKSGKVTTSNQFFLRCPGCTNSNCSKSRSFVKAQQERLTEWTKANIEK